MWEYWYQTKEIAIDPVRHRGEEGWVHFEADKSTTVINNFFFPMIKGSGACVLTNLVHFLPHLHVHSLLVRAKAVFVALSTLCSTCGTGAGG